MSAIAQGQRVGLLAVAEPHVLGLSGHVFDGPILGHLLFEMGRPEHLVSAVAKWLIAGQMNDISCKTFGAPFLVDGRQGPVGN